MGIYRDNLSAIVIGDNFLPIIVIAQNSFDLSITDIAFVVYYVIAEKLSRQTIFYVVIKVSELALYKKYIVLPKCCCSLQTSLFVSFNATAESVNCSLFLKNLETHFCNVTCKKNFVKRIESWP